MIITTYNSNNGEILSTIFGDDESVVNNLNGYAYINGAYDSQAYYVDINNKQAISKGTKPGINYTWNYDTKSWQANIDQDAADARTQRGLLLTAVDRVNPLWYASLTVEQQQELSTYRTALLNVPEQAGFPNDITWPSKPTWL